MFDKEEEEIFAKLEYRSNINIDIDHEPNEILYIEEKNMLLYEWNGSFYALNVENIKDISDLHKFQKLPQKQQKFNLNIDGRKWRSYEHLYMLHLSYPMNSIFAIKSRTGGFLPASTREYPRTAECAIFKLESGEWIDIKPFKWSSIDISGI